MLNGVGVALAAVLVLAVVLVGLLWMFQRKLVYFPATGRLPAAATVIPGAEDVSFTTADGLRLNAWFVPPAAGRRATATVMVLNGNAGNRADRAPLATELSQAGHAVLLVDYRGYGDNPGTPTERGLLADARAAREWLTGRGDADPDRLVYFGESLGAAVALQLAVEQPPAALVLRSPFTSLAEVGQRHYPLLPVGLLLKDRYDSIRHVRDLRAPLLVIAGDRDSTVPPDQSRRLAEAAPSSLHSQFVRIRGAGHNDPALFTGEPLLNAVTSFISTTVDAGQPPTAP